MYPSSGGLVSAKPRKLWSDEGQSRLLQERQQDPIELPGAKALTGEWLRREPRRLVTRVDASPLHSLRVSCMGHVSLQGEGDRLVAVE